MRFLLPLLLLVPALGWLVYWFRRTPPARVSDTLRKVAMWAVVGVLVLAALTGRLSPIFALLGALIPAAVRLFTLVQAVPALQRLLRSLGIPLPGGLSAVRVGEDLPHQQRAQRVALEDQ